MKAILIIPLLFLLIAGNIYGNIFVKRKKQKNE